MALLNIDDALGRLLSATNVLESHHQSLSHIGRRQVLAQDISAQLTQPPFRSSAMDGYALRFADYNRGTKTFKVIGEAAAGRRFNGALGEGETVRIFTGAPVPDDADTIIIQENIEKNADGSITLQKAVCPDDNIRPAGGDFKTNDVVLKQGKLLSPAALALCASSGHASISVVRRPRIAILATGDELVLPGHPMEQDQIICSNSFGLAQIARNHDCDVIDLGIARDDKDSIRIAIDKAKQAKADLLLTSGGVSVGEYDLVQTVLKDQGMDLDFWKIAMRPGKPLMFGTLPGQDKMLVLGLPGNPVSSLVCAHLFLVPILEKMSGRHHAHRIETALLTSSLPANGPRRHFMRATLARNSEGKWLATPVKSQDSSLIKLLANADCLIIQDENSAAMAEGDMCKVFIPDDAGL